MMPCMYCGSGFVRYAGIDDGGGDYGDSVCDSFECEECGMSWETNCIEVPPEPLTWYNPRARWAQVIGALANVRYRVRRALRLTSPVDDIPF